MKIQCALQLNYFLWIKFTYTVMFGVICHYLSRQYIGLLLQTLVPRGVTLLVPVVHGNICVTDVGVCWRKLFVRNQKKDAGSPFHCLVSLIGLRFYRTNSDQQPNWVLCHRFSEFIANPMCVSSSTCYRS